MQAPVSRFWLTYNRSAASSADHHGFGLTDRRAHAASLEGIDQHAEFVEGHKLDQGATDLVPATAIGRMLSTEEAAWLIRRIERQIPKRPAVASVRHAVKWKRA
jgi:hypothetical protein